ncbi:enoyl-CoA hydratase-related protein [Achromobacter aegrifaciens]
MTAQTIGELPVFESVLLDVSEGVGRLTLNRPETLNALNDSMFRDIPAAIDAAGMAGARVLLITGAGRAFCSGADLVGRKMNTDPSPWRRELANRQHYERVIRLVSCLNEAPMPVVSAINGVVAGGGVGIALGCDVVLMARSARIILPFIPKLGVVPDVAVTWLMSRTAGRAKTLAATLLGESISAEEADRGGLVWKVIDDALFDSETASICSRLANTPQAAARGVRRLVDLATELPLRAHIGAERDVQARLVGGADFAEGVAAFREKRSAKFSEG